MTCATCVHFLQTRYDDPDTSDINGGYGMEDEQIETILAPERGRWGTCRRIGHGWGRPDTSCLAYTMDASGYASRLHVRNDFSCAEWVDAPGEPT